MELTKCYNDNTSGGEECVEKALGANYFLRFVLKKNICDKNKEIKMFDKV